MITYETRVNPLIEKENVFASLPLGSTEEEWALQFNSQKVMYDQLENDPLFAED